MLSIATMCLIAFAAHPQTTALDKARLLYDAQLLEDAKKELVAVASSEASPGDKASALHLLGTIAVDEQRYDAAIRTWSDLVAKYPNTSDAQEVTSKIPLVRALAARGPSIASSAQVPTSSDEVRHSVVVASSSLKAEYAELAVDEISNFLIGAGVDATKSKESGASLPELLPTANQIGATSILVLTLKFGYLESLRAECYLVDGGLQWEEKASGSFGFTKSGVAAGLIDRIKTKLQDRIGDPCLPKRT